MALSLHSLLVLAVVMAASFGIAAPTPAERDVDTVVGVAAVSSRDTEGSDSSSLKPRDLSQIFAYASDSMIHGPNIDMGVLGIIVENNPNGDRLPTSPP